MESIGDHLKKMGDRKPVKGIHSELHEMVAKLRSEFGETATKGKGSFGFYLRLLKKVPVSTMHQWLGNINDSPNLKTPLARCKIFWWHYKKWKNGGKAPPKKK